MNNKLYGFGTASQIVIAHAYKYSYFSLEYDGEKIDESQIDVSLNILNSAAAMAKDELDRIINTHKKQFNKEAFDILSGQLELLKDPEFIPKIQNKIIMEHCSPKRAIYEITTAYAGALERIDNPYWQERSVDIRDAGIRLQKMLIKNISSPTDRHTSPFLLVTGELSASEVAKLDTELVLGFATSKGSPTSHCAIFAKILNIPAVLGIPNLLESVSDGDILILDGEHGEIIVSPDEHTVAEYQKRAIALQNEYTLYVKSAKTPAQTSDGKSIIVEANIGTIAEIEQANINDEARVGLFRTEWQCLVKGYIMNENELTEEYVYAAKQLAPPGYLTIRTLDIGGDKVPDGGPFPHENNPALGYRGIRRSLGDKDGFKRQLRAILRASAYGDVRILLPMISTAEEILEARECLAELYAEFEASKQSFDKNIKLGIMIETPAAAIASNILANHVDFFSIGTNDLIQYLMSADRENSRVSKLCSYRQPAVIHLLDHIIKNANAAGISLSLCGDMASDVTVLPILIGLGIDTISVPTPLIGKIKQHIRTLDSCKCKALITQIKRAQTEAEVSALLNKFQ